MGVAIIGVPLTLVQVAQAITAATAQISASMPPTIIHILRALSLLLALVSVSGALASMMCHHLHLCALSSGNLSRSIRRLLC